MRQFLCGEGEAQEARIREICGSAACDSLARQKQYCALGAAIFDSLKANRTEKTVDFRQRFFLWRAWRDSGGDRTRLRPAFFVSPPKCGRRFRCAKPQKTPAVCCILLSDGSNPCIAKQKTTRLGGFSFCRVSTEKIPPSKSCAAMVLRFCSLMRKRSTHR